MSSTETELTAVPVRLRRVAAVNSVSVPELTADLLLSLLTILYKPDRLCARIFGYVVWTRASIKRQ